MLNATIVCIGVLQQIVAAVAFTSVDTQGHPYVICMFVFVIVCCFFVRGHIIWASMRLAHKKANGEKGKKWKKCIQVGVNFLS